MQKFIILISLVFFQLSIISEIKAEENKLVVYTYESFISDWGPGPEVEKSFEKICDCDLQFVGLDSSIGILGRLKLEGLSSEADVILGLDTNLIHAAEKTGLLVEPKNLKELGIAIEKLVNIPLNKRNKMASASRKHIVNNFSLDKMTSETLKLYNKILKNNSNNA